MTRPVRPALRLERLEARDCPALSIINTSTALIVRGTPAADLTITGTATPGKFTFMDGAKFLGTYSLNRNLQVQLNSEPGDVLLDLNANTITGSVLFNLGKGHTGAGAGVVDVYDSTATTGVLGAGTVRGSLTVLGGNGNERVFVGLDPNGFDNRPMTIRGSVTAAGKAAVSTSDTFLLGDGSVVRGSVSVSNYEGVSLGDQDLTVTSVTTIAGSVSVTTAGVGPGLSVTLVGRFGGNVSVNGAASTAGGNQFTINPVDPGGPDSVINGNLNVRFGSAIQGNFFTIAGNATETSIINGNVTLTSTSPSTLPLSDLFTIAGTVQGNLTMNLGVGDNDVDFQANAIVMGNMLITGGNGTNSIGAGFNTFAGQLQGNLTINLGNGSNTVGLQTDIGGKFTFRGGNGTNDVSIDPTVQTYYLIDLLFGTGTNTLTLDSNNTASAFSGRVTGTGGSNTFVQNSAVLLPTLYFINFP